MSKTPLALGTMFALASASCATPSLMAPTSAGALAEPGAADQARVVFVQGPFDGWYNDHASIVDESGRLLGESWPDTWFAVDLPPGEHEFFGWQSDWAGFIPFAHGCTCFGTQCAQIAAMRAQLQAGKTYYVLLRGVGAAGKSWAGGHAFDFLRTSPWVDQWPPSLLNRLRHIATVPQRAAHLMATAGGGYEGTIVCMGRKRMAEPGAWTSSTSELREADGR